MSKEKTTKIEVVQVNGQKLDPNAQYLFVWNEALMIRAKVTNTATSLQQQGFNIIHTSCVDPERALKVYQIPKHTKLEAKP